MSDKPQRARRPRTLGSSELILDEAHLNKNILRLALPAVGEMLLRTLVGVVDSIMIGQALGEKGLATVGLAGGLVWPVFFLASSFSVGSTAVIARLWGARSFDDARRVAGQSVWLGVVLGLVLTVVGVLLLPLLLKLYTDDPVLLAGARTYVSVVAYAGVAWVLTMVGNSIMRGLGDNIRPLIVTGSTNLLNITLNYLLIFGPGPFPALGIRGAALASAISLGLSALLAQFILFSGKTKIKLLFAEASKPVWKTIKRIFHVGAPAMVEQGVFRFGHLITVFLITSLGSVALASHQVGVHVESISFMPGWGLAMASTTLVGQYLGAGKPKLAERAGFRSAFYAVMLMGAMGVVFSLFASDLVGLFVKEGSGASNALVHELGTLLIVIAAVEQPGLALLMTLTGGLRGAGDTRWTLALSIIGLWGLRIPACFLAIKVFDWGIVGFWGLATFVFYLRAGLAYWRFSSGKWKALKV